MSEYEITRCLALWKGRQSTSYLVVDSQYVNDGERPFLTR